ncbi:MAG: cation transporter [Betaproteobacteria bacterium]
MRLALAGDAEVTGLSFDLAARLLTVWHTGDVGGLTRRLESLGLGARLEEDASVAEPAAAPAPQEVGNEAGALRAVLAINAGMFLVEAAAGWLARSTGLLADSLDMLADASVYGLALYAAGGRASRKRRAAHASGWLQLALAAGALAEVVRRARSGGVPEAPAMIAVALLALAANVVCLLVVTRHRHAGAHMRASVIFSANDVLANLGVIAAGALVSWTGSRAPDLVIGSVIALVVLLGAVRILRLR